MKPVARDLSLEHLTCEGYPLQPPITCLSADYGRLLSYLWLLLIFPEIATFIPDRAATGRT
jgi:hypothetical protein